MTPPNIPNRRPPLAVRLTARAAIISLMLAVITGLLAYVLPPPTETVLELMFWAASASGVTALLLWVIFSGVHIVFSGHEEDSQRPPGDLF